MPMLKEVAFYAELEDARRPRGSGKHPFSQAWSSGGLTREQLGQWAVQHYYYISAIPQQFAALYARMPDPQGREMLMENLAGEEPPHEPEKSHPRLLLKFARACGLTDEDVTGAEIRGDILPGTRAMRAWIWELATLRPINEACAGIMVALEGQLPTLYPGYISAMEKLGFTDDELEFFHVHVENDDEHAEVGLQLCHRFSDTPDRQKMAVQAVRGSAGLRYDMLSEIQASLETSQAA
ncbi:TenA family transcriptional regulator [Brevundimonas faecalis]|uniref:Pyrroloquinoline-quinone synthase n=1 Tax=Brevundimonas faecalis TaxID=947378 RepID=A0ABV2R9T2_9CAUL